MKDLLKTGMVIEMRSGRKAVVMVDTIFGDCILLEDEKNHNNLEYYNKDGKYVGCSGIEDAKHDEDIIKVWTRNRVSDGYLLRPTRFAELIKGSHTLVWETDEEIEMTVAEVEEKLGIKNLKIVK